MKLDTIVAVVSIAGAACGGKAAPSRDAAPVMTLGGELRSGGQGQPVILVRDDADQLQARTLDHVVKRQLVPGAAGANVLYDPETELLWYLSDKTLWVVDLRGSQVPVPIVERVETSGFMVDGASSRRGEAVVALSWTHPPTLSDSGPPGEQTESDEEAARIANARLVGTTWLDHNLGRRRRHIPSSAFDTEMVDDGKVDWTGRGECSSSCGIAATLGNTGLLLVMTEHFSDHDGPHHACSLYDPKLRRFVDERANPHLKLRLDCDGQLDRDAERFVGCASESDDNGWLGSGAVICTSEGCTMLNRRGACSVGFLDPGVRIVDPLR
jgi:hypothetical protein